MGKQILVSQVASMSAVNELKNSATSRFDDIEQGIEDKFDTIGNTVDKIKKKSEYHSKDIKRNTNRCKNNTKDIKTNADNIKKNREIIEYNYNRIGDLEAQSFVNHEGIKTLKIDFYRYRINALKLSNKIIIFSLINTLLAMICIIGLTVDKNIPLATIFISIGMLIASAYMAYIALDNHSDIIILKKEINRLICLDIDICDMNKENKDEKTN